MSQRRQTHGFRRVSSSESGDEIPMEKPLSSRTLGEQINPKPQSHVENMRYRGTGRRSNGQKALSCSIVFAMVFLSQVMLQAMIPSFRRILRGRNEYEDAAAAIAHAAKFPHSPFLNLPASDPYQQELLDKTGLRIIWLMSFPNSGTSYTIRLIRGLSMQFSASNYGEEYGANIPDSVPVIRNQTSGPFWMDEPSSLEVGFSYPTKFVLAKTHCKFSRCEMFAVCKD